MPLQTVAARGVPGVVEIDEEFAGGLADVDGFSHLLLLTHLHRAPAWAPRVVPFLDDRVGARIGWFAGRLDRLGSTRSDGRFASGRGGDLGR